MGDYERTTDVDAGADALFDYLSDVHNLPKYMRRMTSAEPGDGEEVHTTAEVKIDGKPQTVEGDAWFRVDRDARTMQWDAEGESEYRGELEVSGDGDRSSLAIKIHTDQVESSTIDSDLEDTLDAVKRLVEEQP